MATTLSETTVPRPNVAASIGKYARNISMVVVVVFLLVIVIFPVVWLFLSSLKAPDEFSSKPVYALPDGLYFKNYVDAWTVGKMSTYFLNSVLVVFPSLILGIGLSTMAAFGIEIMRWKFKNVVLLLFLAGIMVPLQMVILPLFTIYYNLHLINTLWGLILTYVVFGLPLTIFLLTGFFKNVPKEVLEAGIVDGANIYQVFWRLALPMIMNSVVTVAMVQFFFIWNDVVLSLTFNSDVNLRTVQTGLLNFVGQYGARQWGPTFAAIFMSVAPTLILYLSLNGLVVKGLTAGAVKG